VRDDLERIRDILDAIQKVEKYAAQGKDKFHKSELIQVWVIHHIQIIGEAASKVSEELKAQSPEIPWPEIIAMRNILVHDYFGVDEEEVWSAVKDDLPALKKAISKLAKKLAH
jgi:uncharacterized protein with HEPN domain